MTSAAHLDCRHARLAAAVAGNLDHHTAQRRGVAQGLLHPHTARAVFGHELAVGACADQGVRLQVVGVRQELEEVRFPVGHGDDRNARRCTLGRLCERDKPLRAFLFLDRRDLQALDLLLVILHGDFAARPDALAQDPKRHPLGREGERVVHDKSAVMRGITLANWAEAPGLDMPAVGEKHRILHHTSIGPPQPAMRAAVASLCGFKILAGLALGLLNSRYAACVPAHVPHASLIGELGDWARYSAVFIKRRSRRLSERSAQANSCLTHATDSVPAVIIACTSGSSQRLDFRTPSARSSSHAAPTVTLRNIRACVSTFVGSVKRSEKIAKDVCNRKGPIH